MRSFQARRAAASPITRGVRRWLLALNVALMLVALGLAMAAARRALLLVALVPLAFAPFCYARLRFHHALERALERRPTAAVRLAIVAAGLDAVMIAQLLTARLTDPVPLLQAPGVAWIGAVWFSAHALLLLGYAVVGLARLPRRALHLIRARRQHAAEPAFSPERRQFLQQAGVLGAGVPFIVSLSNIQLSYDFQVQEHEITLPHWPRALDGLRVAHLSDIHVGGAMNRDRLRHIAALTRSTRPDLVLHTGDFLTHRSGDFDVPLYEALAQIPAPYGHWACFGNHDFDDPARLVRRLADAGVTALRGRLSTLAIDGQALEIAGLDFLFQRGDRTAQYAPVAARLGPRTGAPRLLLNHDPSAFAALPGDVADLVLSGHTHGGHIGIQLGPERAITVVGLVGIPDQGLFERGDMRLFVTRCVGFYGYPMRLGIPPEIALLTLRAPV